MRSRCSILSIGLLALAACGDESRTTIDAPVADAPVDAPTDATDPDAAIDAAIDADIDAADPDAAIDAAIDARTDAATDASVDASAGPVVVAMSPQDGLATATTAVRLIGFNLVAGTTITFNGVAGVGCTFPSTDDSVMLCSVPPGPIGRGPIVLTNPNGTFTGLPGWTHTGVRNETDVADEVDYCNLQFPTTMTLPIGSASPVIYGRIYEAGRTEAAGAPGGVLANVGYGPTGTSPLTDGRWRFFAAGWNVQVGNDDEFYGGFYAPGPVATWSYTFRFSFDTGLTYTYCDLDGAGSNPGLTLSTSQLGAMDTTN